jgi:hypothetical protein
MVQQDVLVPGMGGVATASRPSSTGRPSAEAGLFRDLGDHAPDAGR